MLAPLLPASAEQSRARALITALWARAGSTLLEVAEGTLGTRAQTSALRLLARLDPHPRLQGAVNTADEALNSHWPEVQAAAIAVMGRREAEPDATRSARLMNRLGEWAQAGERKEAVRLSLAKTVGRLGSTIATPNTAIRALRTLLEDPATPVRLAAIEAARRLDDEALLEALADRVSDTVADVARAAASALESSQHADARPLLRHIEQTQALAPVMRTQTQDSPRSP